MCHNVDSALGFKFPSLNTETERFLLRRKADVDSALKALETEGSYES